MKEILWQHKDIQNTQMYKFMRFVESVTNEHFATYQDLYNWSIAKSQIFWGLLRDFYEVNFHKAEKEVLNNYANFLDAQWFTGAKLNYAQNLLKIRSEKTAIIAIDENYNKISISFAELYAEVAKAQAGLLALGVKKGDRVAGFCPNTYQTIVAFLAAASIGAIWSSCSTDFGVNAVVDRFSIIEPVVLFTSVSHQYNGKEHLDLEKAFQIANQIHSIKYVIAFEDPKYLVKKDLPTETTLTHASFLPYASFKKPKTELEFASLDFSDPLYILFSSGTTGKPKCIVHRQGGVLLQHLKELGLHSNLDDTDNLFFYTTCGWMMWNWMVSALALGCTITLYEGSPSYPNWHKLFRIIEQEKVTAFGTSAKFLSSIEKEGIKPKEIASFRSLKIILTTGSPLLPKNYDFVYEYISPDIQLSSISGGTDLVSCFALGNPILPVYRGELQCLGLGMAVAIYNDDGKPVLLEQGELVCVKPFPTMPIGFWGDIDNEKYKKSYFSKFNGVWAHGDYAKITKHGGLVIYGRSDAILNPGGVRIGTAEIYRQIEKIPEILDSVVVGQNFQDDVRVILFVKLKDGTFLDEELVQKVKETIRENASPRHVPAKIIAVNDIPRTINGKVVEVAVRDILHGKQVNNIESIANPSSLEAFKSIKELEY